MTVDLNRWSATEVMGWSIVLIGRREYYCKIKDSGDPNDYLHVSDWSPLTDKNQLFMVVEKMRELEWYLKIDGYYKVEFLMPGKYTWSQSNTDLNPAVLRAAREALEKSHDR